MLQNRRDPLRRVKHINFSTHWRGMRKAFRELLRRATSSVTETYPVVLDSLEQEDTHKVLQEAHLQHLHWPAKRLHITAVHPPDLPHHRVTGAVTQRPLALLRPQTMVDLRSRLYRETLLAMHHRISSPRRHRPSPGLDRLSLEVEAMIDLPSQERHLVSPEEEDHLPSLVLHRLSLERRPASQVDIMNTDIMAITTMAQAVVSLLEGSDNPGDSEHLEEAQASPVAQEALEDPQSRWASLALILIQETNHQSHSLEAATTLTTAELLVDGKFARSHLGQAMSEYLIFVNCCETEIY